MNDDKQIINLVRQGHVEIFSDLVVKYQKKAHFLAFRYLNNWDEADDMTQTAFIKLYQYMMKSKEEIAVSPWMSKVIINLCLDQKKSKKWKMFFKNAVRAKESTNAHGENLDPFDKIGDVRSSPEQAFLNKELGVHIDALVDELPDQQKRVFYMKHFEGLKIKDIAQKLNISEGQIKSQLFRAVHKLRKGLEAFNET